MSRSRRAGGDTQKRTEVEKMSGQRDELREALAKAEQENERLKRERATEHDRETRLLDVERMKERKEELKKELEVYAENDPELVERLKKETEQAKDAANRWTDGVFVLRKYAKDKLMVEEKDFNKNFGIPDSFDYIE